MHVHMEDLEGEMQQEQLAIHLNTARFLLAAGRKAGAMAALSRALGVINKMSMDYYLDQERACVMRALSFARRI